MFTNVGVYSRHCWLWLRHYAALIFAPSYLAKEKGTLPSPASGLEAMDENGGVTWLIEDKRSTVVQRFSGTLSHTRLREDLPSLTVEAFAHFAFGHSNNTYVFADLQGMPILAKSP